MHTHNFEDRSHTPSMMEIIRVHTTLGHAHTHTVRRVSQIVGMGACHPHLPQVQQHHLQEDLKWNWVVQRSCGTGFVWVAMALPVGRVQNPPSPDPISLLLSVRVLNNVALRTRWGTAAGAI